MIVYPFLYYFIKIFTLLLDMFISPILAVIALLERMFPDPQERQKRRMYQQQRQDRSLS
ncbi:hypothetical protein T440DRAFT_519339 [Plenodomus tracheiphilus IPT5]|uniref:Uncharacterized protein n=1 Tax=Plenodomus tracheiphilus IPT5 TaxID=1408161 RepID=A0A6A7B0P2_9PLEO|nr:hypothetical protein T440DRAFT_519339 [Plenodomus tracheiphilus IPT5]